MKKTTKKDRRRLLIWSMMIFTISAYLGVFVYNYWSQILTNNKESAELEKKYSAMLEEEQNLSSEVIKLEDPSYIAKFAREKYMYSKPGELIIKISD